MNMPELWPHAPTQEPLAVSNVLATKLVGQAVRALRFIGVTVHNFSFGIRVPRPREWT